MRIGLVHHATRPAAVEAATRAAELVRAAGAEAESIGLGEVGAGTEASGTAGARAVPSASAEGFAQGLDVVVSFGGDGTFLRAAHLCRDLDVPLLGVNVGRLGFLAEVEVEDLEEAVTRLVEGRFAVDSRATLDVDVRDGSGTSIATDWALNEVAIEKTSRQRLIRLDVSIAGTHFAHVPADALIVATATGSTAYALSAGGPIVSPGVAATLVVPVAPHSLFDRTVVAAPTEQVRIGLSGDQQAGVVSCDGRVPMRLEPGGSVTVTGGGTALRVVRVGEGDFYALVRRKFGLR
jgi:NAD+ kinase